MIIKEFNILLIVLIMMMKPVSIMTKTLKLMKLMKQKNLKKINIHIYTQDENDRAEIDRRNSGKYDKDIYLLRYNNHFCLIKILKLLSILSYAENAANLSQV